MAWLSCEITEMLVYPIDYNSEKSISLFKMFNTCILFFPVSVKKTKLSKKVRKIKASISAKS